MVPDKEQDKKHKIIRQSPKKQVFVTKSNIQKKHDLTNVALIGQDIAHHLIRPALDAAGGRHSIRLQFSLDLSQGKEKSTDLEL